MSRDLMKTDANRPNVRGVGRIRSLGAAAVLLSLAGPVAIGAQDAASGGAAAGDSVTLQKVPVVIRPADSYQVPLSLAPAVRVTLPAATDGPVAAVLVAVGDEVAAQSEVLRLDDAETQLLLQRAQAAAADAANPAVAEIDLKLAQLRQDRTRVTAPILATVSEVHVVPGQYVRTGDPLLTLSDRSRLRVRLPVERGNVKPGDKLTVAVEGKDITGDVLRLDPPGERFAALQDLFESVATAVVEVDNSSGGLFEGQAVRSDLIPREPIIEADNAAVSTDEDGVRRVFVLRQDVAVSVPVQVLGAVSPTRTFLSGRFGAGDELVVAGHEQLVNGAVVRRADDRADHSRDDSSRDGGKRPLGGGF